MNAELRRLLDERDIVATAVRYTWALDERDWDALADVFVPDATADLGSGRTLVGLDEIRERIAASLTPLDDSQHIVGNHQVRVDGDTATHRCYLHSQHIRHLDKGSPNYVIGGRYEDRMVRTEEGWRITHRTLVMMWNEGNRDVVRR